MGESEKPLSAEDHEDSVVLRRAEDLPETTLEDLIGCTGYKGPARSLEEMNAAIAEGASHYSRSSSDAPVRRSSGS